MKTERLTEFLFTKANMEKLTSNFITIRRPDDFHVHLRTGGLRTAVQWFTSRVFGRAIVMPNINPPITTPTQLSTYREAIMQTAKEAGHSYFTPLMTFYATDSVKPEDVPALKAAGAVAGKYYPKGVTTGSEAGATSIATLYPLFAAMEENDLVLCLHGEVPGVFTLDREEMFLQALTLLARTFPKLRIVLEHVTTELAVGYVKTLPSNVAATITAHHLCLTLDDVIGDKLNPHAFCKPVAKRESDRRALVEAATSGQPKFFFGSDSAPHLQKDKECASGCAGVFTAPLALELVTQVFANANALDHLEAFMSMNGARFYGLAPSEDKVTLVRDSWEVPKFFLVDDGHPLIPFRAGEQIEWRIM